MKRDPVLNAQEVRLMSERWIRIMEENLDLKEAGRLWIEAHDKYRHLTSTASNADAEKGCLADVIGSSEHLEAVFRRILERE